MNKEHLISSIVLYIAGTILFFAFISAAVGYATKSMRKNLRVLTRLEVMKLIEQGKPMREIDELYDEDDETFLYKMLQRTKSKKV